MINRKANGRRMLGSLALLVCLWGVLGWFDLQDQAQAGFTTGGNNHVTQVYDDSPASVAGLQVGDRIVKIDGYAAEDARSLSRLPRMKAGDERTFMLERDGVEMNITVMYAPLSERSVVLARTAIIVGFCFLLFPLLALFRVSTEATRLLTVMGTGISLAFLAGPYIGEASIRGMVNAITTLFILFGVAALAQFLLVFPNRRPALDRKGFKAFLYLPVALLWVLLAWRMMATPVASSGLNTLTSLALGLVVGGYFLFALFRILRNYSQTDQAQRKALGLNLMLWGTVLGLIPVTIAQLVSAFSPQTALPGQDYYFVSLALIPLTWARSASRV